MVKDGEKELFFKKPLVISEPSEIFLKSAIVYWNYNNIDGDNDFIAVDGDRVEFIRGYYCFKELEKRLKKKGVAIVKEPTNEKCVITANDVTYFKSFGLLLGLEKFTNMAADTTIMSPNIVDINRGLKYMRIKCGIVDRSKNIDDDGNYSDVLVNLPIPSNKTLVGTQSCFDHINSVVKINEGVCSSINFKVDSNIDQYVGDILLELYIRRVHT